MSHAANPQAANPQDPVDTSVERSIRPSIRVTCLLTPREQELWTLLAQAEHRPPNAQLRHLIWDYAQRHPELLEKT